MYYTIKGDFYLERTDNVKFDKKDWLIVYC